MVWLMREEERRVEMPEEWGGIIPSQVFLDEAKKIVGEGNRRGLTLRVMGGVGVRLRVPHLAEVGRRLGRLGEGGQEFTDLDFMSYKRDRTKMKPLFESLDYIKRKATLSTAASERQIYLHPKGWFFVDVFFDELRVANHPLDFRGRLELDPLTISPTDFLLEKLQIVAFSEKDLKDTVIILLGHEVGDADERGRINAAYLAKHLANDWGFWYTVTNNLAGLEKVLPSLEALSPQERDRVTRRLGSLRDRIEAAPKSLKWKTRARIGTRVRWYEPVETMETVGGFGIWRMMEERPSGKGKG